jgi:hypothetical protein
VIPQFDEMATPNIEIIYFIPYKIMPDSFSAKQKGFTNILQ